MKMKPRQIRAGYRKGLLYTFLLLMMVFFGGTTEKALAGSAGFVLFYICSGACPSASALFINVDTDKNVYAPGETITFNIDLSGDDNVQNTCPVVYGIIGGTMSSDMVPGCYTKAQLAGGSNNVSGTMTAPLTAGPFILNISVGSSGYANPAIKSITLSVAAGTIGVTSNIAGASYTITGPATIHGSGFFSSYASQPTGAYTIIWNPVAGYTTPASSSQTLSSGGTISFVGNYSGVAPTCSYTGPINWVEPTGLECSVGVSYNSIPVGGQRTATDSDASGNGYTGSYTAQCDGSGNFQYVSHVCNAPVVTTINVNFE